MNSTLSNLWNGNLSPVKHCGENNTEIKNLVTLIEKNGNNLAEVLNAQQQKIFDNLCLCIEEYLSLMLEQAFEDGFGLACKLLTSVFNQNEAE